MVWLTKESIPHMAQLNFNNTMFETPQTCSWLNGRWLGARAVNKWLFLNDTDVKDTEIYVEPTGRF